MSDSLSYKADVLALLAKVPMPPEDETPAGATVQQVVEFEKRAGMAIPPKLRSWLLACNGPCVGPGGVFGIKPKREDLDIEGVSSAFPNWREKGWIPVAGDGCGNYYVVATSSEFGDGEPVLFIDIMEDDSAPAYIAASDVWRFLWFFLNEELGESNWPFDRDEVTKSDPDILSFHNVNLPWNA